ncbi:MAG: bifunctional riboflavin kinase/FMN adenylyltransferase [Planctomycetota bacterium]|nr:bifunctional riboflavin kinase/FMN adenylyltransferase [Planctomycetota bacterium]
MARSTVITIGTFDGVHRGHQALLAEARRLAGSVEGGGRVVALAFHPNPIATLAPQHAPPTLTEFDRREQLLRAAGADRVVRLEPSPALLGLSADAFIERVVSEHAPRAIVEGADFRFGKGRAGDNHLLRELGRARGFDVSVLDPVTVELTDQSLVTASSTMTRWLVQHGRVRDAARLLGRPHELSGVVVRGDRLGRTIGFPTANLRTAVLLPADGVYAGRAHLPDGRGFPAAIHVGPRATFDAPARTVEAYLLDWRGPLEDGWSGAEEYGWSLRLTLTSWLRDQAKFDGVGLLVEQIRRDVERTRALSNCEQPDRTSPHSAHQTKAVPA